MNDRELLELTAFAVGIVGEYVTDYSNDYYYQGNTDGIFVRTATRWLVCLESYLTYDYWPKGGTTQKLWGWTPKADSPARATGCAPGASSEKG